MTRLASPIAIQTTLLFCIASAIVLAGTVASPTGPWHVAVIGIQAETNREPPILFITGYTNDSLDGVGIPIRGFPSHKLPEMASSWTSEFKSRTNMYSLSLSFDDRTHPHLILSLSIENLTDTAQFLTLNDIVVTRDDGVVVKGLNIYALQLPYFRWPNEETFTLQFPLQVTRDVHFLVGSSPSNNLILSIPHFGELTISGRNSSTKTNGPNNPLETYLDPRH